MFLNRTMDSVMNLPLEDNDDDDSGNEDIDDSDMEEVTHETAKDGESVS